MHVGGGDIQGSDFSSYCKSSVSHSLMGDIEGEPRSKFNFTARFLPLISRQAAICNLNIAQLSSQLIKQN